MAQLSESEVVARSDANFVETFRALARTIDGAEVRDVDGLARVTTGLQAAAFNVAFVMREPVSPRVALSDSVSHFKARELPFVIRFMGYVPETAADAARDLGLVMDDSEPGMALLNDVPVPAPHSALEIHTAQDTRGLEDHGAMLSGGFGMPPELVAGMLSPRLIHELDAEFYVGYVDGQPVTSSALIMSYGVAGVYNVATLPGHRGKGLGEAMTWHAVRRGRELGCLFSSLQASKMGQPIYERMGYRVVTTYPTFTTPGH